MTTNLIKLAQSYTKDAFNLTTHAYTTDEMTTILNSIDYFLDRALDEAKGDETVLELRDKHLARKRARIKEMEEELQNCYKALNDMSDRCDYLREQNDSLTVDCQGTEAALNETQTRLTVAEDECHYYKETIDALRSELKTRAQTIDELSVKHETRVREVSELYAENAELKAKIAQQNEIVLKLLYGEPLS